MLADFKVSRAVVRSQCPRKLINAKRDNGHCVQDQKHKFVHERMREKGERKAVDACARGAVRARTRIVAACLNLVLAPEEIKARLEADALRGGDDGEEILSAEAEKGMPVSDALVVQAYLNEKHGQDAVLGDVEGDGAVDDDFTPKSAFLRVYDNGEDRSDLDGKDEPALSFLELDERRGNGNTGAGER